MKKILNISILSLFCHFAITSCNDSQKPEEPTPFIEKSDATFDVGGGTGSILVSAKGGITATADRDWCKADVAGKTVNLTVSANDDITGRTALVSIHADGQTLRVPVTQKGIIFTVSVNELQYSLSGGVREVTVKSNLQYSVYIPDNDASWMRYIFVGDVIRLTAIAAAAPRTTTVEIRAGNAVKEIAIIQN